MALIVALMTTDSKAISKWHNANADRMSVRANTGARPSPSDQVSNWLAGYLVQPHKIPFIDSHAQNDKRGGAIV